MRTSIAVAALFVFASAGCSHRSPTAPPEAGSFVLALGQSISYGALTVSFLEVSADSRCPADATCLQFVAGDATVVLEILNGGSSRRSELQVNDPSKRHISQGGYLIELTQLSPYPLVSRPIARGDYRATIEISPERASLR
jgi:hypothetical protein